MLSILWIAGIVAGFIFPAVLIKAIRTQNEEESAKHTFFSCLTFGICMLAVLVCIAYA